MSKGVSFTKKDKDPTGGLTASGRRKYNRATGGNLQAPVTKKTGLSPRKLLHYASGIAVQYKLNKTKI